MIYFDGCEWTWGSELKDRNQRFSTLVCGKLGVEEKNVSHPDRTNDGIVRQLVENSVENYSLVVIQMTTPSWTEVYEGEEWKKVKTPKHLRQEFGEQQEWRHWHQLKDHCATHSVPLILITLRDRQGKPWDRDEGPSKLPFDLYIGDTNPTAYPRSPNGHPSALGHAMIAEDIIKLITYRGVSL